VLSANEQLNIQARDKKEATTSVSMANLDAA